MKLSMIKGIKMRNIGHAFEIIKPARCNYVYKKTLRNIHNATAKQNFFHFQEERTYLHGK